MLLLLINVPGVELDNAPGMHKTRTRLAQTDNLILGMGRQALDTKDEAERCKTSKN
jgi:hypothetical protein